MKSFLLLTMVLAAGLVFGGCASAADSSGSMKSASGQAQQGHYEKVSPEQAHKLLQEDKSIVLVDVRTAGEYAEKHIPGARLVPNETIKDQPIEGISKDAKVLVYCRTGHRSQDAANKLLKMGYEHVYDMDGGITRWTYETEAGAAEK